MSLFFRFVLLILVLLSGYLIPGQASTVIVPPNLGDMARSSEQVVLANVVRIETFSRGSLIITRTTFETVENVKGLISGRFEVESPGGVIGNTGLKINGSPEFETGKSYLLMLSHGKDGAWRPKMLSYGLLQLEGGSNGYFRPLPQAQYLDVIPAKAYRPVEPVGTYEARALLQHLRQVVTGTSWDATLVQATDVPSFLDPDLTINAFAPPAGCAFLGHEGHPVRWNRFDLDAGLTFYIQEGATPLQANSVMSSTQIWGDIEGLSFAEKLVYGGERPLDVGCVVGEDSALDALLEEEAGFFLGDGMVLFGDPCEEIEDLSEDCEGVLAFGGSFFFLDTHPYNGVEWRTAALAFIIVNNGVEECLGTIAYHQTIAHEMGHTLGFGHHTTQPALMNAYCCNPLSTVDTFCAKYAYGVLPPNDPPVAAHIIDPIHLILPGEPANIHLDNPPAFTDPDGDTLVYRASINIQGIIGGEFLSETHLRLYPLAPGEVILRIQAADNKGGAAFQDIPVVVTLKPNETPYILRPMGDLLMMESAVQLLELAGESPFFADPDDDPLTFSVVSDHPNRVNAVLRGSQLRLTAQAPGSATITITADDNRGGTVSQHFEVVVNGKPVAIGTLGPFDLQVAGDSLIVDITNPPLFMDPEGEDLRYSVRSGSPLFIRVLLQGNTLSIAPVGPGRVPFYLVAADIHGNESFITATANVAARPNQAPEIQNRIETLYLRAGDVAYERDLTADPPVFTDADGDELQFMAVSMLKRVAEVEVEGTMLRIFPLETGRAQINLFAVDGFGGNTSLSFVTEVGVHVGLDEDAELPQEFAVGSAYPNPFNPVTNLPLALPSDSAVEVFVYDVMGRTVWRNHFPRLQAGHHSILIDLKSQPSGVYLVQIRAGAEQAGRRITLIK